jgi:hypothetical protein
MSMTNTLGTIENHRETCMETKEILTARNEYITAKKLQDVRRQEGGRYTQ